MAVVTIVITESSIQLIDGIPKFVIMTTNIPSTIFYTFDGVDPTTSSLVYTGGELVIPTNQGGVTFKIFATNGTDSSAIIERTYRPNIILGRQTHDEFIRAVDGNKSTFPYGTAGPDPQGTWQAFGPKASIVDKPDVVNIFDGYDGTATGTATGGTDLPLSEYPILFSESNKFGERGRGLGTLPAEVTEVLAAPAPLASDINANLFNPRALVIFQDSRVTPSDPNILQTNRQYFALENVEKIKDGILLDTLGIEGAAPTGSFVRQFFNPRENTITYYYHDSQALRWIISTEPFTPTSARDSGLQKIVFSSRGSGSHKVFHWVPFKGSRLI